MYQVIIIIFRYYNNIIPDELLKNMGNDLFNYVAGLINVTWKKKVILEEWKTALIYPIHRKGNKQNL